VDLGITHPAVSSSPVAGVSDPDGVVPNPGHLAVAAARPRRASRTVSRRQGPDRSAGRQPSRRWAKADRKRTGLHRRVAALRRDGLHRFTTGLAAAVRTVVVEDLNVAGMLRNHRLARSIADAGFGPAAWT
jgi:putative transposase